ncbi:MAG: amphi-Trp domain-containing protein [Pseudomonadota bacterium]
MTSPTPFLFESREDAQSIQAFLESLMQGFEKQRLVFSSDGKEVVLSPQGLLDFSVKASCKSDTCNLTINIAWREADEETLPTLVAVTE